MNVGFKGYSTYSNNQQVTAKQQSHKLNNNPTFGAVKVEYLITDSKNLTKAKELFGKALKQTGGLIIMPFKKSHIIYNNEKKENLFIENIKKLIEESKSFNLKNFQISKMNNTNFLKQLNTV